MVLATQRIGSSCAPLSAWLLSLALAVSLNAAESTGQTSDADLAQEIVSTSGVRGGVIVHVGCGDGRLTAALYANGQYLVHGLDTHAEKVQQARNHLKQLGRYGPVSVDQFDGRQLPYADNLVNLLVVSDAASVDRAELERVVAPGGVAVQLNPETRNLKPETLFRKPRPDDVDEWTHFLHDASGNAVAHDRLVGPPRYLQWTADPPHTRGHEYLPSIFALVSTGGRIFYIADQSPIGSVRDVSRWELIARDAYNGTLLWKRPVGTWFPHLVNWGQTPRQLERKLVAVDDRVYVTLGLHAPLSVLDAATGETLQVIDNTEGTEEIVWHDGVLLLAARRVTGERVEELKKWAELLAQEQSPLDKRESAEPLVRRLRATEARGELSIIAVDAATGELLWKKTGPNAAGLRTQTLSALGDRAFYQQGGSVVCLDLKTGRDVWTASVGPLQVVQWQGVICADGRAVTSLSLKTGEPQWRETASLVQVRDVFVANGSLWIGGFKPFQGRSSGKRGPAWGAYYVTQRDLGTGKILRQFEPENPGHHHRCYQNKATDRFILAGRRGTEFIDLETGDVRWHSWARGGCKYGVMPCNGLLYVPPHSCGCYITTKLTGFNALAAESGERRAKSQRSEERGIERLERGPAYGEVISNQSAVISRQRSEISGGANTSLITDHRSQITEDWVTYRGNAGRSGHTTTSVPPKLDAVWQSEIGGKITPPAVAGGRVYVAQVDSHRVCSLDARTGDVQWTFTAGARVDSPPTVYKGMVLFGCRDGRVYCLRAADGQLVWRLQAAGNERLITAGGQLESASPVHGSVLVRDGVAFFTTGRISYLDGGMTLYRVEPETGKILSITNVYSPDPETGKQPAQYGPNGMPGIRSDILSSDDDHVYLRQMVFDPQGSSLSTTPAHLFTLTDYLDDSWTHRSYWIFGTHSSLSTGCSGRDRNLIYGRLLVFDESTIYGYGRSNVHWSNQLEDGPYRLFAVKRVSNESRWSTHLPHQVRAMVLAGNTLFVAGLAVCEGQVWASDEPPDSQVLAISTDDGTVVGQSTIYGDPVFDGMAAANGRLFISMTNGRIVCLGTADVKEN